MEMRFFVAFILCVTFALPIFSDRESDLLDAYYRKDYSDVIHHVKSKDQLPEHLILKTLSYVQLKKFDLARSTYASLKYSDHLGHYDALIQLMINQDRPFKMTTFNRLFSSLPADPTPNYVYDIWLTYLDNAIHSKDAIKSGYLAYQIPITQVPLSVMPRYVNLMVKYQTITSDNVIDDPSFYPLMLKYPFHFTSHLLSKRVKPKDREAVLDTLTRAKESQKVKILLASWAPPSGDSRFDLVSGKSLYQLKDFDSAMAYFTRIPTSSCEYDDAQYYLAKNDFRTKHYPDALLRLESLLGSPRMSAATKTMSLELAYDCISMMDSSANILSFVTARNIPRAALPASFLPRIGVEHYYLKHYDVAFDYFKEWMPTEDTDRAKRLYFLHRCEVQSHKKPLTGYGDECFYTYPDTVYAAMLAKQEEFDIRSLLRTGYDVSLKPAEDVVVLLDSGLASYVLDECKSRIAAAPKYTAQQDVLSGAWIFQRIGQYGAAMRLLLSNGYPLYTKSQGICRSLTDYFYPRPHWDYVQLQAEERGIDPNFSVAIMREESTFNPRATSVSGAMGLMQLMPNTAHGIAKSLKIRQFKTDDLYTPKTNIQFGSHYLGFLSRKFDGNPLWMAAGYNAGPNAAQRWKDKWKDAPDEVLLERIPFAETNAYAKRVLRSFWIYSFLNSPALATENTHPLTKESPHNIGSDTREASH